MIEWLTAALKAEIAALEHVAFCDVRGQRCDRCDEAETADWAARTVLQAARVNASRTA